MSQSKKTTSKFFTRHKNAGRRFQRKKWDADATDLDFTKKNKIYVKADIRADIEHAANIMCLHFGLSKSSLINHALAQLWEQVYPTIRKQDLARYDARIKEYVLFRAYKDSRYKRDVKQIRADTPSKEEIQEAKDALNEQYKQHLQSQKATDEGED